MNANQIRNAAVVGAGTMGNGIAHVLSLSGIDVTLIDESADNPEVARHSNWLLFFRLEVHFGNAYKKRYEDHI